MVGDAVTGARRPTASDSAKRSGRRPASKAYASRVSATTGVEWSTAPHAVSPVARPSRVRWLAVVICPRLRICEGEQVAVHRPRLRDDEADGRGERILAHLVLLRVFLGLWPIDRPRPDWRGRVACVATHGIDRGARLGTQGP